MSKKALKTVAILAGVVLLIVLILYTGGFLVTGKIAPGKVEPPPQTQEPKAQVKAVRTAIPEFYLAVGTVRPRTEVKVAAQVSARVVAVKVRAGQEVKKGQLLVLLNDQRYRARLGQARQGLAAARAVLERAESEYRRIKKYLAGEAATQRDLEAAREARLQAEARVRQAQRQVEEAQVALGYTRITAPEAGQVVKRLVEPGDMALPGQPLLILQTEKSLLLEALVREGLIYRVKPRQVMEVEIPALDLKIKGRVSEIIPSADPRTRTFLVKVALPPTPGLHTGMFGRLLVPVGRRTVVLVPQEALRRVGQLEMVTMKGPDGRWMRVHVTTGRRLDGKVEILSGLNGGETLALENGPDA